MHLALMDKQSPGLPSSSYRTEQNMWQEKKKKPVKEEKKEKTLFSLEDSTGLRHWNDQINL